MSESQEKVLDLRSVFGFQATVTILSAATEGEGGELDCTLKPGGDTSIHYHPEQEESLGGLIRAGKIKGLRDHRSLMYMSIVSTEQEPSVAVKPPQRVLKALAFVGRRLGYRLNG